MYTGKPFRIVIPVEREVVVKFDRVCKAKRRSMRQELAAMIEETVRQHEQQTTPPTV